MLAKAANNLRIDSIIRQLEASSLLEHGRMNWESIRRFSRAGIFLNPAIVKGEPLSLTTGSPAAAHVEGV